MSAEATVYGETIALHRNIGMRDKPGWERWAVTHLPTSVLLGEFLYQKNAKALAAELAALPTGVTTEAGLLDITTAETLAPIIRRHLSIDREQYEATLPEKPRRVDAAPDIYRPCWTCRQQAWRQRDDGGWLCGVCHPK